MRKERFLRIICIILIFVMTTCLFTSCHSVPDSVLQSTTKEIINEPQVLKNTTGDVFEVLSDGSIIDYSNKDSGYIMVKVADQYENVRLQVLTPDDTAPVYPIYSSEYEAIPLSNGTGEYSVKLLCNNDGGTSYSEVGSVTFSASPSDDTFLRPNLFCNFDESSSCVSQAEKLTRGIDSDVEKIEAIYNYVIKNFKYDYEKAESVATSAYVPNLVDVWQEKTGICFDYSATLAAMLRTQGIRTKICAGYYNGALYHAWVYVYVEESGKINDTIEIKANMWTRLDPTFASTDSEYDSSKGSYQDRYYY